MYKLTRQQKRLLTHLAIGGGALLLFLVLMILPKYFSVKRLQAEVDHSLADYHRIQNIIFEANGSGQKFKGILANLEDYRRMVPLEELVPEAVSKISSLAQRSGLEVVTFEPKEEATYFSANHQKFEEGNRVVGENIFAIELRGSFFSLGNFISLLEEGPYKIIIKKIIMQNPDYAGAEPKRGKTLNMKITFSLLALFDKNQKL